MLIDTHVHLCDSRYNQDREQLIERAKEAGVSKFINIGAELEEARLVKDMVRPGVKGTIGLHPHYIEALTDEVYAEFESILKNDSNGLIAAVGEIGLDYFKSPVSKDIQIAGFRRLLELARDFDKPVVIHSRDAHDDVAAELKVNGPRKKGVIHCFTGGPETAAVFVSMGYMLGIGGVVTFPNSGILREAVKQIPLSVIVLETDAPWLAPQSMRGKRNEPAMMTEVARKIAEIKEVSYEEVCDITTKNAETLFGI